MASVLRIAKNRVTRISRFLVTIARSIVDDKVLFMGGDRCFVRLSIAWSWFSRLSTKLSISTKYGTATTGTEIDQLRRQQEQNERQQLNEIPLQPGEGSERRQQLNNLDQELDPLQLERQQNQIQQQQQLDRLHQENQLNPRQQRQQFDQFQHEQQLQQLQQQQQIDRLREEQEKSHE